MKNVVEFEQVSKIYSQVTALDNLSLQVAPGEVLGLLGHNGAGKTTTIKLILGMIEASAGKVHVLGESPRGSHAKSLRMQWGYLPESMSYYEQLTAHEVLDYFGRLKRVAPFERKMLLEQVGLADAANRRVKTYSKGMRQRLGLAQALLGRPRLLLLDEPTVGLDPIATRELYQTLDGLRQEGTTIILSSHVLSGIEKHIDKVAILRKGKLQATGSIEQLRHDACLPTRIIVKGAWPTDAWKKRLQADGVLDYSVNGARLEVTSSYEAKLETMRMLLADNSITDFDVIPPSLESLYVHYNYEQEGGDV